MYDWPEVRDEVDAVWAAVAGRLREAGVEAPASLWRPDHVVDLWDHPDLLVGQTCGADVVGSLAGRVEVLGALDYGVEGCRPGDYRSVLVCRAGDPAAELASFRGRRAAVNGPTSLSGNSVLAMVVAPLAEAGRFFGGVVETGSHRESIRVVAGGGADLASVDAVAWALAASHEPAADGLRVVAWTDPLPAPPLVVCWAHAGLRDVLNAAVAAAVASLGPDVRRPLDLYGYRVRPTSDYGVVSERQAAAAAAGYPAVA